MSLTPDLRSLVYKQASLFTDVAPSTFHELRTAEVVICIILEKTARSPSTVTARLRSRDTLEN